MRLSTPTSPNPVLNLVYLPARVAIRLFAGAALAVAIVTARRRVLTFTLSDGTVRTIDRGSSNQVASFLRDNHEDVVWVDCDFSPDTDRVVGVDCDFSPDTDRKV